jgi:hypothetical protein
MSAQSTTLTKVCVFLFVCMLITVSCTQATIAAPVATQIPPASATPLPPTQPPPPPTATPTQPPTLTFTLPPTPSATSTPAPTLGLAENGFSAWCLPEHGVFAASLDPVQPPADATIAAWSGTALEVNGLPSNGCVFVYTFNQTAPQGLTLEISDQSKLAKPFLTANLVQAANPNVVYAVLHHSMIIAPPFWNISFHYALKTSSGAELRLDTVNLHRWVPKLCWNGRPPNVFTLRCPLAQDLHPWDPSYGTPIPTFPPEDD